MVFFIKILLRLNINVFQYQKVTKSVICVIALFPPPPSLSRCGSVVLDFMMRFNQSVVVSNVLTLLSDAARQRQFEGFEVNPDSIELVLIPTDGSESTPKGKYYREIVESLHVSFRK